VGKKARSEKFFGQKVPKNCEFHEKVYAEVKTLTKYFPKLQAQLCLIEFLDYPPT